MAEKEGHGKWATGMAVLLLLALGGGALTLGIGIYQKSERHYWGWFVAAAVLFSLAVIIGMSAIVLPWWHARTAVSRAALGKPRLVLVGGIEEFRRKATDSRAGAGDDLQIVYARVKNQGRARAIDAEVWMEAFDDSGRVAWNKGGWYDLSAGEPNPVRLEEKRTLGATPEEHGLEVVAKFLWGTDAWLSGGKADTLPPGTYRVRSSVSYEGSAEPTVFEWKVTNEGADKLLRVEPLGNPQ